jgi:molybdopterin-synthase adenylyltransferase
MTRDSRESPALETPARVGAGDASGFDYATAFSRNIGWLTEAEQATLRRKRVAIAGMGGVGGVHLTTLARLGVAKFHIADLDRFEVANFNRQAGATMTTLGRPKVEVLAAMARDINPECELEIFPDGVDGSNLARFFQGVDLYVDGLDAFAFGAREAVFAYCAAHRVPATTVAPLGMSAALLNFMPGGMTFEEYFRLSGCSDAEKAIRFLVGFAPSLLHRHYLVDKTRVDLAEGRGPSTGLSCQLCAGVATAEALKILLGRGKVWAAPHAVQFDAFRNKMSHTWRPGGNRHPLNRLAIAIAKRQLGIR